MSYELEKNLMNQELYLMGEDAGIEKKEHDMIINMFNKKLSLDFISDIVKLPIKEVRKIIVKYQKQNNIK